MSERNLNATFVTREVRGGPADGELASVVLEGRRFVAVRSPKYHTWHRFFPLEPGDEPQPYYTVNRLSGALVYDVPE